jgi:UDP-N-acetylglucosamine acyltransferase
MGLAKIHPTAMVDPSARLADDVEVGAYAIIESDVEIGPGSVIRPHAVVRRFTSMGSGNYVDSFVSLGGEPQDYKFDSGSKTFLRIGDDNIFREGVTISRATTPGSATTVGNATFWMANSHAGHDCQIHDGVILPNGCNIAGHCTVGAGAILPANGNVHQFVYIGPKVMFQGCAQVSMHVPPFVICAQDNNVVSLNVVGLKRSPEISNKDRLEVKEAFGITYRSGLTPGLALAR